MDVILKVMWSRTRAYIKYYHNNVYGEIHDLDVQHTGRRIDEMYLDLDFIMNALLALG